MIMTSINCFGLINGLPEYGDRVDISNTNIGDVITYKLNGSRIFSVILGITQTNVKFVDLICENTTDGIILYISNEKNIATKCLSSPLRRLFKVKNVNRT
jgi:hypothetical protein